VKKFVIVVGATLAFVTAAAAADLPRPQPVPVEPAPIGKMPIGKSPIGKAPLGKAPAPVAARY
jgi:opacity protein-like surface antigen